MVSYKTEFPSPSAWLHTREDFSLRLVLGTHSFLRVNHSFLSQTPDEETKISRGDLTHELNFTHISRGLVPSNYACSVCTTSPGDQIKSQPIQNRSRLSCNQSPPVNTNRDLSLSFVCTVCGTYYMD